MLEYYDESVVRKLWKLLPSMYRESTFAYTDFWNAYGTVIPKKRHRALDKLLVIFAIVNRLGTTSVAQLKDSTMS